MREKGLVRLIIPTFSPAIIVLFVLFLSSGTALSEKSCDRKLEYAVKAALLGNIVKFIQWPPAVLSKENSPISIGIVGDDPFGETIEGMVRVWEPLGSSNGKLAVKRFSSIDKIDFTHVLFISSSEKGRVGEIKKKVGNAPTLLVGDFQGAMREGIALNFILQGRKVWFECSQQKARERGLKMSSYLLSLSR